MGIIEGLYGEYSGVIWGTYRLMGFSGVIGGVYTGMEKKIY